MTTTTDRGPATGARPRGARAPLGPIRTAEPGDTDTLQYVGIDLGHWSSTVTLSHSIELHARAIDPAQLDTLRADLAALLHDPAVAPLLPGLLTAVALRLPPEKVPATPGVDWLRGALLGRPPGGDGDEAFRGPAGQLDEAVRHAVCLGIEDYAAEHPEHADVLAPRLAAAYEHAFTTPALRRNRIWPVGLWDRFRVPEIRSVLALRPADVERSALVDGLPGDGSGDTVLLPDLKRRLLERTDVPELAGHRLPGGWRPDSDLLIGLGYAHLGRIVADAVAGAAQEDSLLYPIRVVADRKVSEVAVTYPTVTPPSVRDRLRHIVADALCLDPKRVYLEYDEAIAAGLYFVMRGFGGDADAGIRAFRAAATEVPDAAERTWRQYMAVLDLGGGTADIALLALDLVDRSGPQSPQSPQTPADGLRLHGREYLLRPHVLGTTGHQQLGGDLLTLRLFYWLKAAIVDAIRASRGEGGEGSTDEDSLVARVLRAELPDPVPDDVRRVLRAELPTHSAGGPDGRRARTKVFDELWTAAETAKVEHLSKGRDYTLPEIWTTYIPDQAIQEAAARLAPGSVVLRAEDFARMVRPMLDVAVGMTATLVRRTLGGVPGARLDVVALSGRTTAMPVVRELVEQLMAQHLSAGADGGPPVAWDPSGIIVERRYAKQAASIGAAWARSITAIGSSDPQQLRQGHDLLVVRADNLLLALPADFGLATALNDPVPWLRHGQPLDLARADGRLFVRTEWRPLIPDIQLHRLLGGDARGHRSIEWGRYEYGWHRGAPAVPELWYQLEIDQELTAQVSLCRGTPTGVRPRLHPMRGLDRDSLDSAELAGAHELREYFADGELAGVPQIEVVPVRHGDPRRPAPVEVFAAGTAEERLGVDIALDGARVGLPATVGGAVSARPLPDAVDGEPADEYLFLVHPGQRRPPVVLAPVRPPRFAGEDGGDAQPRVPVWAVLDARGSLRVHSGYPEYLRAESLEEMERHPGYVHTATMDPGTTNWDPAWDPFTGDH
ncbi:hypothetical protein ABZS66_50765 [Dactylosporangium sp. NPDC005572]|uniref:hypothetical protein n=1 Tax=Dactylosporangium sp. NPDC005572 TaxID=3156889 RepID=UPI0033A78DD0